MAAPPKPSYFARFMDAALSALDRRAIPSPRRRGVNPDADAEFFGGVSLSDVVGRRIYLEWRTHPTVYGAVNAYNRNVKTVPWRFWTGREESPKRVEPMEWQTLFDRPNPLCSAAQFWGLSVFHLLTCNRGLIVVKQGRDAMRAIEPDEVPLALWPMSGKLFTPVLAPNDETRLMYWRAYLPGLGVKTYQPHEVIFIRIEDDRSWWKSLTPLEALKRVMEIEGGADEHNAAFFKNGATIGGVFELPDGYTEDQVEEKELSDKDKHVGASKAHGNTYLTGGMKFIPTGVSQRDMEFLGQKEFNREEIRTAFWGLPKSELGLEVDVNMITGAGAQSSDRGAWTRCYVPIMRVFRDSYYKDLFFPVEKGQLWGAFDESTIEALRPNLTMKAEQARSLMGLGWTRNEVNDAIGMNMPKDASGDVRYIDAGLVPEGEALPDGETPPPPAGDGEAPRGARSRVVEWWGASDVAEEERAAANIAADVYLREVQVPMESSFNAAYRRGLMKARGDAIGRVGTDGAAFDLGKAVKGMRKELGGVYRRTADRAESRLGKELKDVGYGTPPKAPREFIDREVERRMRFIDKGISAVEKRARESLADGRRAGETVEQLERRVRDVFNAAARKSHVVARTEASAIGNAARFRTMKAAGVEDIQWLTMKDERVRESHRAQHGLFAELGTPFPNGLRYPHDPAGSEGEVVNCRCISRPARAATKESQEALDVARPNEAAASPKNLIAILSQEIDADGSGILS